MELTELNRINIDGHVKADFACDTSEDGHIFILSENDIKTLEYIPNMESSANKLKFNECTIKLGDFHIADYTGVNLTKVVYNLPREELYKIMSTEIFTPKFEDTNIQVTKPISLSWSPKGVYKNDHCALATVSNTGNVEIFIKTCEQWIFIANLTQFLVESEKKNWNENLEDLYQTEQINIHMNRVLNCAANCVCWSPIYENNESKFFYVTIGYLNGAIRLWKLNCFDMKENFLKPELIATKTFLEDQVTVVYWSQITNKTAWIICGGLNGIIKAIPLRVTDEKTTTLQEEIVIWEYADIRCFKIDSINSESHSYILLVKGQHLVISLLDNKSQTLVKNEIINIGNYIITGLSKINENTFLVLTLTGIVKLLKINTSVSTEVRYEIQLVINDIDWRPYCAKGILKSPEGHIWGIIIFPAKVFDHLSILKPTEIAFCIQKHLDPGKFLKENESQKLYKYWEMLEIIRCVSIEKQTLPSNWVLNCEIFDDISLYELRIMYWLTLASTKLLCYQKSDIYDKAADTDLLEKFIYLKHNLQNLEKLYNKLKNGELLNKHQLLSLYFTKHSVLSKQNDECVKEYFSEKYLNQIDGLINNIDSTIDIPVPDCIICDNPLTTGKCDHPDDRCVISNVQIMCNGKWHCKYCKRMAHEDIEDPHPFCTICDIRLLPYDPQLE